MKLPAGFLAAALLIILCIWNFVLLDETPDTLSPKPAIKRTMTWPGVDGTQEGWDSAHDLPQSQEIMRVVAVDSKHVTLYTTLEAIPNGHVQTDWMLRPFNLKAGHKVEVTVIWDGKDIFGIRIDKIIKSD